MRCNVTTYVPRQPKKDGIPSFFPGKPGLFRLLVHPVRLAPFAKFGDLKARLDRLLVLPGMVVDVLAFAALQLDEVVLRHSDGVQYRKILAETGKNVQRWSADGHSAQTWPGADGGNRTHDLRFTKALLYQLSYVGLRAAAP